MTMADDCCDVSKIVSTFLLNTCRLPPRLSRRDVQAAACCAVIADVHPDDDKTAEIIPLTTGSVAEFYIEPMLPLVGDIDVMYHHNRQLAIPQGHLPPTQLPAEFHNYVDVYEIIDSHLPGYVYLEYRYKLTQCTGGKYNYTAYDEGMFYLNLVSSKDDILAKSFIHGPASFADNSRTSYLSTDAVHCIRCLSWPPQASDWLIRHRNYGWPDSATLDRVVSNGCDVVGVAHRQCREDELKGKFQHRLSCSRAEIVLINSWMPVQQIVYHMLRHFVKIERLTDSADESQAGTLSNYHIKTLMLWACELKSRSWWTEDLNLVRICVELLQTLSVWLIDTRCPHYFINNCNLLDNTLNMKNVASQLLMSMDEKYLSTWLMKNYTGQCAQLCPLYISRLLNDFSSATNLESVVTKIIHWRLSTSLDDKWKASRFAEVIIAVEVPQSPLTVRSCISWMNELSKIDHRFRIYFSAFALLHVARKASRSFNNDLLDILAIILGSSISQCCSVLTVCKTKQNMSELVELLQKSAVERLTTYRQLLARDLGSEVMIVTTDYEAM